MTPFWCTSRPYTLKREAATFGRALGRNYSPVASVWGKERVQKLMQLHGIRAKGKRRLKVTTDSNHDLPIPPNLLNREFAVAAPDRVWVGYIDLL